MCVCVVGGWRWREGGGGDRKTEWMNEEDKRRRKFRLFRQQSEPKAKQEAGPTQILKPPALCYTYRTQACHTHSERHWDLRVCIHVIINSYFSTSCLVMHTQQQCPQANQAHRLPIYNVWLHTVFCCEPVWPSGKALGW